MVSFNINALLSGGGGIGAIGTAFGLPSCILNLGLQALSLIPTPILIMILKAIQAGMRLADGLIQSILNKIRDWLGYIGILNDDGEFVFLSKIFGALGDLQVLQALGALAGFISAMTAFAGDLYANYQAIAAEIKKIKDCLKSFKDSRRNNGIQDDMPMDPQAFQDFVEGSLGPSLYEAEAAIEFLNAANLTANDINEIVSARYNDPGLEPIFNNAACELLSGTILAPYCAAAQAKMEEEKPIFRLNFGPPKSSQGQFILSNDGLYFDSQVSGIVPALTFLALEKDKLNKGDLWKFVQNPNLGGRGQQFSINDLKLYVNTILDPDRISEVAALQNYYNKDGFLQELLSNRNKRIYDLSCQISELQLDNASQLIILNLKQSLISENQRFIEKINKRKKQIELAVVLPTLYNSKVSFSPGEVPINDFSYLAGTNIGLDLQKQKSLVFSQVDISGVVSPIELRNVFVETKSNSRQQNTDHLIIAEHGDGAIIFDGSGASAVDGVILQTETFLTTNNLVAMYNFLDTDVVLPSSTNFYLRNSASVSDKLYAQLVATNPESVFSRGLGIAYLNGITKNSSTSPTSPSALGSFVRLPNTLEFNDLFYSNRGCTLDFWVYMPDLLTDTGVGNASSLYRLVLANENVGFRGQASSVDSEYVTNNFGTDTVRGLILGFTRDRRLCNGLPASNDSSLNPASATCFFLAPTQSISTSAATLVNRSEFDGSACRATTRYHSMIKKIDGSLVNCSSQFCHFAVVLDPQKDQLDIYFDGVSVATSAISKVFGIAEGTMPNLPTFAAPNSFEYNTTTLGNSAPSELRYGPKLDTAIAKFGYNITPWIVGGGYTDGMQSKGNFMGGSYGGIISGLRGYLGSIKFYSKALTNSEVLNNYKTHKNFFKNIDTSKL